MPDLQTGEFIEQSESDAQALGLNEIQDSHITQNDIKIYNVVEERRRDVI